MKSLHFNRAKNSLCGRTLRRLLGEEKGAVAMEYIVIALLVAAAVVGLVMVFGGNLRNMFDKQIPAKSPSPSTTPPTSTATWRSA